MLSIVRDAGHLMDSINTSTAMHRLGKVVRRLREREPGAPPPGRASHAVLWLCSGGCSPAAGGVCCLHNWLTVGRAALPPAGLPARVVQDGQYRRLVARVAQLAREQAAGEEPRYQPRGLANTLWGLAGGQGEGASGPGRWAGGRELQGLAGGLGEGA